VIDRTVNLAPQMKGGLSELTVKLRFQHSKQAETEDFYVKTQIRKTTGRRENSLYF